MKYIEAERVKAEIDKIVNGLKSNCDPNPLGTTEECLADAEIEALNVVKDIIDKMKQEHPTPPGIEKESQKKGWLDLGFVTANPTPDFERMVKRIFKTSCIFELSRQTGLRPKSKGK